MELIIVQAEKSALSKEQQLFNKLIKKIEKLHEQMIHTTAVLDKQLNYYGKHIHPLMADIARLRKVVVKLMYGFLTIGKGLSSAEKDALCAFLINQLVQLFSGEQAEEDEELKEIYTVVYDMMHDAYRAAAPMEVGDTADRKNQDHPVPADDDIIKRDTIDKGPARKKTKKQLKKEEMEEASVKSISTIYRELAKIFHPDLEQDPALVPEKEELMKQLTIAKEKGDLLTMLQLELAWIYKENSYLHKITGEKLELYNSTLKEQIKGLEKQLEALFYHPRYAPLLGFALAPGSIRFIDWKMEKQELLNIKQALSNAVMGLSMENKKAIKALKEIIQWNS